MERVEAAVSCMRVWESDKPAVLARVCGHLGKRWAHRDFGLSIDGYRIVHIAICESWYSRLKAQRNTRSYQNLPQLSEAWW